MMGVRNFVTNSRAMHQSISAPRLDISNDIKVVPASGVEPERLAAGDFKSPTYSHKFNNLGAIISHAKGVFYRERDKWRDEIG
jgi:hypothetical protein